MRAVLTYHSLDDSGSPISVRPEVFERHVKWLASGRVRLTALDELSQVPDDVDAVALTFDDGFENVETIAVPLLRAYKVPVTVFVVSQFVGRDNNWGGRSVPGIPTLPLLSWHALERLTADGIQLGAHSRTHRDLTTLTGDELDDEIRGGLDSLRAALGSVPTSFAYPYGKVNERIAARVGLTFPRAYTTEFRTLHGADSPALLPRLDMYYFQRPGQLETWGTPAFARRLSAIGCRRRVGAFLRRSQWTSAHPVETSR